MTVRPPVEAHDELSQAIAAANARAAHVYGNGVNTLIDQLPPDALMRDASDEMALVVDRNGLRGGEADDV